jgi:hypothetical protein
VKIELCLDRQELQGNKSVKLEMRDKEGVNIGTFLIGKGGVRWQTARASINAKAKSWNEVIEWLESHGRTIRR